MRFSGFDRNTLFTPVPNPLFGPLLEQIQDLAELKVTLRGLWLLRRQLGRTQAVRRSVFLSDTVLLRGLKGAGQEPEQEIGRGLELSVARGTFLLHRPASDSTAEPMYLLNTDGGRAALARMRQGASVLPDDGWPGPEALAEELPGEKPSIFALYENNVGMLSPLIAEQLKEAERDYPLSWIDEAIQVAVIENKRSWRYIAGILRRWAAEGKDNGKPGRHPEKDHRQKYLRDYERRWGRSS